MPRCCVPFCNTKAGHRFPKDPKRKKLWLMAIRRSDFVATEDSRICRNHFLPSNYVLPKDSIRKTPLPILRPDAIPSQFRWNMVPVEKNSTVKKAEDVLQNVPKQKTKRVIDKQTDSKPISIFENTEELPKKVHKTKQIDRQETPNQNSKHLRDRSVRLRNKKAYLELCQCSVPKCHAKPSKEISLHPCPNNAAVRNDWAEALNVSYQYVKNMVACSLHFYKTDFIQSIHSGERALKQDAVPSRNLPKIKEEMGSVKQKPVKKEMPCKNIGRPQTMTDNVLTNSDAIHESVECRACLKKFDDKKSWCNVFQAWAPPWGGMEPTIAEDLAKLANVEISITDRHSKIICAPCYQKLLDAAMFATNVRSCDLLLRQRVAVEEDIEKVWPKPIQVDKNIDGSVFNNTMDIEIKQEVVSDEEYAANATENSYAEAELANLDIKIEPEEIVEPPPMNITINGTISLDPLNSQLKHLTNGTEEYLEENTINVEVKQEPMSEEEPEIEQAPDLSLDCLLCTKSFNSVTGLKAHVIAQHSYKTVKRKSDGSVSPERKRKDKYQCAICRRSFVTSTDLMVHETCHNKHACYGCTEKFDTFELLTQHRKRCKASQLMSVQKLKTLEDVKRPLPEEKVEHLRQEIVEKKLESKIEGDNTGMKETKEETKIIVSEMKQDSIINQMNCDVNIIVTEVKGAVTGVNIADSDANITDSDVNIADSDVILAENDVNIADSDVNIAYSDVNKANNDVNLADSDVNLAESNVSLADSDVNLADSDVNLAESDVNLADSDVIIADNDVNIASSKVQISVSEIIEPNSTVNQESELDNDFKQNDNDNNMKLNLEINSEQNETESNKVTDAEMDVET